MQRSAALRQSLDYKAARPSCARAQFASHMSHLVIVTRITSTGAIAVIVSNSAAQLMSCYMTAKGAPVDTASMGRPPCPLQSVFCARRGSTSPVDRTRRPLSAVALTATSRSDQSATEGQSKQPGRTNSESDLPQVSSAFSQVATAETAVPQRCPRHRCT